MQKVEDIGLNDVKVSEQVYFVCNWRILIDSWDIHNTTFYLNNA